MQLHPVDCGSINHNLRGVPLGHRLTETVSRSLELACRQPRHRHCSWQSKNSSLTVVRISIARDFNSVPIVPCDPRRYLSTIPPHDVFAVNAHPRELSSGRAAPCCQPCHLDCFLRDLRQLDYGRAPIAQRQSRDLQHHTGPSLATRPARTPLRVSALQERGCLVLELLGLLLQLSTSPTM